MGINWSTDNARVNLVSTTYQDLTTLQSIHQAWAIQTQTQEVVVPLDQLRPSICFDEWNVWDPIRAEGSKGTEESYTLSDALAVAVWLNVFVRKSRDGVYRAKRECDFPADDVQR